MQETALKYIFIVFAILITAFIGWVIYVIIEEENRKP